MREESGGDTGENEEGGSEACHYRGIKVALIGRFGWVVECAEML